MNERWVCKRCFADNEGSAAACHRCGLTRGAEATTTDQETWASHVPASAAQVPEPGWRKWARLWWIPAIVVVLAVGYFISARRDSTGQIESGGRLSVTDLQVGDCFDLADMSDTIDDVDARRCDEPHEYEVYHVQDYQSATYPTESEMQTITDDICFDTFEAYVGVSYVDSTIYARPITPTEGSFAQGDREYMCILYDPDNAELTTSLRDAAR